MTEFTERKMITEYYSEFAEKMSLQRKRSLLRKLRKLSLIRYLGLIRCLGLIRYLDLIRYLGLVNKEYSLKVFMLFFTSCGSRPKPFLGLLYLS